MVLESTMICVDNSEYMRNGDYVPTRLQAQQDAVNAVCRCKLRANPENNVGLLTLANTEVLATLTTDVGKILTSLHKVQPEGYINLLTGIRIAHLSLKHRQSKNHKMRIVAFVGSPIGVDEKEVGRLAKRLKKENVQIDVINFGETDMNQPLLESLVSTINGREGTGSHLVTVPPSPHLADALLSSPIMQGEGGNASFGSSGGFEFGVDPNEDPELALALRVSMEEQRQRQQEEERRVAQESGGVTAPPAEETEARPATTESGATPVKSPTTPTVTTPGETSGGGGGAASEEEMLQQALAMSMQSGMALPMDTTASPSDKPSTPAVARAMPDFSSMSEEEQIAYAMQISMQDCKTKDEPMEVDDSKAATKKGATKSGKTDEQDLSEVMSDPNFLQEVLQGLPGVDPQSDTVLQAMESFLTESTDKNKDKSKDKEKDKDKEDGKK